MAASAELLPYAKIREDLFRPLSSASARYWITICAALSVVILGMVAWGIQVRDGTRDVVTCGPGFDRVRADFQDAVASDCERVQRHVPGHAPVSE